MAGNLLVPIVSSVNDVLTAEARAKAKAVKAEAVKAEAAEVLAAIGAVRRVLRRAVGYAAMKEFHFWTM